MGKDPAFLFYPGDWLGGTMLLTRHQKGCYIDLLMAQFNSGPLSMDQIKAVLGQDQANWTVLREKFKTDNCGRFFNEKLATEIEKRKNFVATRSNGKAGRHKSYDISYENHMSNHTENENENENENKDGDGIEIRKAKFITAISIFRGQYSDEMLMEFCKYWTEHSEGGRKMRYEMEKVFDKARRLSTWSANDQKFKGNGKRTYPNRQKGDFADQEFGDAIRRHFATGGANP